LLAAPAVGAVVVWVWPREALALHRVVHDVSTPLVVADTVAPVTVGVWVAVPPVPPYVAAARRNRALAPSYVVWFVHPVAALAEEASRYM